MGTPKSTTFSKPTAHDRTGTPQTAFSVRPIDRRASGAGVSRCLAAASEVNEEGLQLHGLCGTVLERQGLHCESLQGDQAGGLQGWRQGAGSTEC